MIAEMTHRLTARTVRLPREGGGGRESAFTFVELVITVFLIILFMFGVVAVVGQGFTFLGTHHNVAALNRTGSDVLDRLQILMTGCSGIVDGSTGSTQFTFSADIDADGAAETVRIHGSGGDLIVTVDGTDSVICKDLNTDEASPLLFNYYSDWKLETEVAANHNDTVKAIKVTVKLKMSTTGETAHRTYDRYVFLRLDPDDRRAAG